MKLNEILLITESVDLSSIMNDDLRTIERAFKSNGFDLKIAGGAVRDLLLGKEPKDIDMATTATPDEMVALLKNFRTIPTGLQHGTITVLGPKTNEPYEITTLRIDTNQDGRHADVEFTKDFKQDAARRDLTYNAMFLDFDGTLHDYFGGSDDLKNAKTRAVGNTGERFKEDYLRILRMFRFSARYGHALDDETLNAIRENAEGLRQISGERIWAEIQKILVSPNASLALKQMHETGVDQVIGLPKVDPGLLSRLERTGELGPVLALASISDYTTAQKIAADWKLSSEERDLLLFVSSQKTQSSFLRDSKSLKSQIVNSKNPEKLRTYLVATLQVIGKRSSELENWPIPVFPVSGQDLINLGMNPGKELGQALNQLRSLWTSSNFTASKDELLQNMI